MNIKLIVGLGNPGPSYTLNRHNVGFLALDYISEFFRCIPFKEKNNFLYTDSHYEGYKCVFIKPMTYMNCSGFAVQKIANFHKISTDDIIVIHDDLDLEFARIKSKIGGGAGGHNGLKSIDTCIGKHYQRIRIGIGRPIEKEQVSNYVLSNFSQTELKELEFVFNNVCDMVRESLKIKNI